MLKKISLLVCTNRPNQPYSRIWKNLVSQNILEKVVLATQGSANLYQNKEKKVEHLALKSKGRSKAIISGLDQISTFAVGLTDDDCLINKNWVSEALNTLDDKKIDLVYGQTKPYRSSLHKKEFCPSTFRKNPNVFSITSQLGKHWLDVGFDNNAAIKNKVFQNIGPYKWWIGPGCLVPAAEDAEFILRSLIAGYKIAYNPKMLVYHDRFLTKKEFNKQIEVYTFGGLVVYGFYALQGVIELRSIFFDHVHYFFYEAKNDLRTLVKKKFSIKLFKSCLKKLGFLIKGLIIAFLFAKILPIPEKENVVKRFYKVVKLV